MFPVKFSRALAIAVCLAGVLTGIAEAQYGSPTARRLGVKLEELPLRVTPPLHRAYITGESGQFSFIVPSGFRIKGVSDSKITIGTLEGNRQFTFTILNSTAYGDQPLNADIYREQVQARHPAGKIVEQVCPAAGGRIGIGFDMQWEINKFAQCTRTVFVPSPVGLLEFSVTSSPADFPALRAQLNSMLISLRTAAVDEKLVVPHVSASDSDHSDARPKSQKSQGQIAIRAVSARSS